MTSCCVMRWIATALGCALSLANAMATEPSAAGLTYSAASIEGWVVDAETGKPVGDVVVLAHWQLRSTLIEPQIIGELTILETKTDSNGRFYFPAWGPKIMWTPYARLSNADPHIMFLKQGYQFHSVLNDSVVGPIDREKPIRTSQWNGKQIPMKSFHGNEAAAAREFYLSEIRRLLGSGKDCEWKEMPLTVAYVLREGTRLKKALGTDVYLFDPQSFSHQDRCGSAQAWVDALPQ